MKKYLERAELANFTFQNDILKPFVILMRSSRSETLQRLIVDCIVQMIKSKVGSIKSGWRSLFTIFTAAADDGLEPIVESTFENVEQVILEHFDQVVGDCFMDCVNCLIGFANNKSSHWISLKAIALLRICEYRLAERPTLAAAKDLDDDFVVLLEKVNVIENNAADAKAAHVEHQVDNLSLFTTNSFMEGKKCKVFSKEGSAYGRVDSSVSTCEYSKELMMRDERDANVTVPGLHSSNSDSDSMTPLPYSPPMTMPLWAVFSEQTGRGLAFQAREVRLERRGRNLETGQFGHRSAARVSGSPASLPAPPPSRQLAAEKDQAVPFVNGKGGEIVDSTIAVIRKRSRGIEVSAAVAAQIDDRSKVGRLGFLDLD
ncbi:hypothetical protein RHGRI_014297 [Rhododendron griersonianum]|uniref:Mon2/Sec7/BIG1-like HDS domain-containing protein n=1 Tax=Rhododendron griersonianum TaxID=479676 RepID=A0AAV6K8T3_9ERIC|nr:hypothetical protein RHGRI_014297 [Rhododendron griersonianum]